MDDAVDSNDSEFAMEQARQLRSTERGARKRKYGLFHGDGILVKKVRHRRGVGNRNCIIQGDYLRGDATEFIGENILGLSTVKSLGHHSPGRRKQLL